MLRRLVLKHFFDEIVKKLSFSYDGFSSLVGLENIDSGWPQYVVICWIFKFNTILSCVTTAKTILSLILRAIIYIALTIHTTI